MNKIFRITFFVAILLAFMPSSMLAQSKSKKKSAVESRLSKDAKFLDDLWYGFNIGGIGGGGGNFQFAISPMIGYKITPTLSVGFLLKMDYRYYNIKGLGHPVVKKFETIDLGPTLFARLRVFNQFFVQGEVESANFQRHQGYNIPNPTITIDNNNKIVIDKITRPYAYVGLGYVQGQGSTWGYNVSLYYNVIRDPNDNERFPIDYRASLTYKF